MYGQFLPVLIENAKGDADDLIPLMVSGGLDHRLTLQLCEHHRVIGIGTLLLTGQSAPFFDELHRSAATYCHALESKPDNGGVLSRGFPLFDAVSCGDEDLARRVAKASPDIWRPEFEYEDDFLYFRFLIGAFFEDTGDDDLGETLDKYEAILDGASDARLDVCRALLASDSESFQEALHGVVSADAEKYAGLLAEEALEPEVAATLVHINIEALALLHFAQARGLETADEYPQVPILVRRGQPTQYAPEAWRRTYGG